ncbi:tetratricopeptide repeat protein [Nonlabens agnitus]|uniref:Tetratricopeptide repeat protein n=1 Tax=Nonlabens agnitus TaxID=870484 RepID=A0A2S9WTT1_9FLAO|nr:tetratricopeptide repeat protein [Nonlabens agnitus]PRP66869.1 hypothetical protein BST86_07040 [Nonlabens agnitus]
MKYKFLITGLAISSLAFAQKKEIRNMEKALEKGNFQEVSSIFSEINESEVEEKYEADYTFYKAVTVLGNPGNPKASGDELKEAIVLIETAKDLGFENKALISSYTQAAESAIFSEAQKSLKDNDQKAALKNVVYLVERNPSNQNMRMNAADLAYRVGDFETAKANYEKLLSEDYIGAEKSFVATNIASNEVEAFPNKQAADLAVMSKKYKDSKVELSTSKLGSFITNLAWMYKNDGDLDKAKKTFSDAQAKYPNDESLKLASADIYLLLGMNDEYEKAISKLNDNITDPKVFENLGIAAGEKENWDQAIDYYKKSIELNPDNYVVQNNIAVAYIQKGNLEETTAAEQKDFYMSAAEHYEKVLKLKPDMDSAKQTLISIYKSFKMDDKAAALEAGN